MLKVEKLEIQKILDTNVKKKLKYKTNKLIFYNFFIELFYRKILK
jgi:hypothetical protein